MSTKQKSYLALATICIVWGITWVLSRHAIEFGHIPPLQLCAMRQTTAGLIFCIYFFTQGLKIPKANEWRNLILLSILMFALSNGLSTIAVSKIGSGLGAIIGAITALWLSIFGYIILKQKPNLKMILGLAFGFLGILIIFYDNLAAFTDNEFTIDIIISIIATITWALGTIYTVKTSSNGNNWYNTGWQMLISGVILTLVSFTQKTVAFSDINIYGWMDFIMLTLGGSVLAFICFMYVLKKLPAAQVSIYVYINPIIAVILSHFVFGEKLTVTLGIGALITLLGVYLVNNSSKVKE